MTESDYLARYTRIESESLRYGAKQFGLNTSIKVHFSSAVHNTTRAVNAIRAVAKKLKDGLGRNVEVIITG